MARGHLRNTPMQDFFKFPFQVSIDPFPSVHQDGIISKLVMYANNIILCNSTERPKTCDQQCQLLYNIYNATPSRHVNKNYSDHLKKLSFWKNTFISSSISVVAIFVSLGHFFRWWRIWIARAATLAFSIQRTVQNLNGNE